MSEIPHQTYGENIGEPGMQPSIPALPELEKQEKNGLAVTAGWLGIVGVILYLIGLAITLSSPGFAKFFPTAAMLACMAGLILGIIGLVQIRRNPAQKGKGWAITGIVIGVVLLCIAPTMSILMLLTVR
jgi:hypothetical protein